jgi:hypothetical protein
LPYLGNKQDKEKKKVRLKEAQLKVQTLEGFDAKEIPEDFVVLSKRSRIHEEISID